MIEPALIAVVLAAGMILPDYPSPADYILPAPFVQSPPYRMLHLVWDKSTDTNVVSYQVLSSMDLRGWSFVDETTNTDYFVPIRYAVECFQIVAVNSDGLKSL